MKRCYFNVLYLVKWGIFFVFDKDVLEFVNINKNKILVYVLKIKILIFLYRKWVLIIFKINIFDY